MAVIDVQSIPVLEKRPGWRGRLFHSANMTFGHWEFDAGATIHEHFHPQEEVGEIVAGEIELTIDGTSHIARPSMAAIVPADTTHSAKALSDGKAIVIDYPLRLGF